LPSIANRTRELGRGFYAKARKLKYAGDSVLAVFGADEAQEDDAEQAAKAGLALLGGCVSIRGSENRSLRPDSC
jgi:class 3 adenylate cyclase